MNDLEADVAALAARIADVVEANGAHPLDWGFCAGLDAAGVTAAGKRRLVESLRARAARIAATPPAPAPAGDEGRGVGVGPVAASWRLVGG